MSVWDRIEKLKAERGWTDLQIAQGCGLGSKTWLSNIRQGVARPSVDAALLLPDVLGIKDELERQAVTFEFLTTSDPDARREGRMAKSQRKRRRKRNDEPEPAAAPT